MLWNRVFSLPALSWRQSLMFLITGVLCCGTLPAAAAPVSPAVVDFAHDQVAMGSQTTVQPPETAAPAVFAATTPVVTTQTHTAAPAQFIVSRPLVKSKTHTAAPARRPVLNPFEQMQKASNPVQSSTIVHNIYSIETASLSGSNHGHGLFGHSALLAMLLIPVSLVSLYNLVPWLKNTKESAWHYKRPRLLA